MPLYELIVIGRCGDPKGTANLLRSLAISINKNHGVFI